MPQELHIVCCYKCESFQVDIVKKNKKWNCKICGEKQSLKKIYGSGSGKECRLQVQRLNDLRKNQENVLVKKIEKQCIDHQVGTGTSVKTDFIQNPVPSTSKWIQYVEINSSPTEEKCQNYNRRARSKTSSPYNKLTKCEDQSRCGSTDRNCSSKLRKSTEINRRRSYSLVNTTDSERVVSRKRPLYIAEESYNKAEKIPKLASKTNTSNAKNDFSSKWSKYASPKIAGDNIINQLSQKRKHVSVDIQEETPPKKRKEEINSNMESSTELITIHSTNDIVSELCPMTKKLERRNKMLEENKSTISESLENKKKFVAVEQVNAVYDLEEIEDTLRMPSTVTQKRKLDISNMGPIIPINKNAGWNLYFDSDNISEPSSNSSAFIELEEDNFEEFEFKTGTALPCSRRNFELFSTVKTSDDLDSILTI